MGPHDIIDNTAGVLLLVLYLSLPPIIAAAVSGTLFSLFQALTQIQEQTLSFAVKLLAVSFTIYATAATLGTQLYKFALNTFAAIPDI